MRCILCIIPPDYELIGLKLCFEYFDYIFDLKSGDSWSLWNRCFPMFSTWASSSTSSMLKISLFASLPKVGLVWSGFELWKFAFRYDEVHVPLSRPWLWLSADIILFAPKLDLSLFWSARPEDCYRILLVPHSGESGDWVSTSGELSAWLRFKIGCVLLKKFPDSRVALLLPAYPGIMLPPPLFSDL